MKILIAEDSTITRNLLLQILSKFGNCHFANNGREALHQFKDSLDEGIPFQLVCLDIMMPNIDGQDVLKCIRKSEEKKGIHLMDGVKVIMITALKDRKNIIKAFNRGCESYIVKPCTKIKITRELLNLNLLNGVN